MTATVTSRIMAALKTALEVSQVTGGDSTVTKPTGLTVHRFLQIPVESDDLPAICIYPAQSGAELTHINENLNRLTLWVEHRGEIPANTAPDEAVDALRIWSHRCIKTDDTLGGLASQCIEGDTQWDEAVQEDGYASCRTAWTVEYWTTENDPRQQ